MGFWQQFATFLYICSLIQEMVTFPNLSEDKDFSNKPLNTNISEVEYFYFDEKHTNDTVKIERAIPQSSRDKEDVKQIQTDENKTGTQTKDEFRLKNVLSYLLNVVQELKKDIFGIKEMGSLSKTKTDSEHNLKDKRNKIGRNGEVSKSDGSSGSTVFGNEYQQPKSNYITEYYKKNGIKYVDDDLENSSDQSDDSSHRPYEDANMKEISENNKIKRNSKCERIKRKPGEFSSEFDNTKTPETDDKESNERNGTVSSVSSKTRKCVKMNYGNDGVKETSESSEGKLTKSPLRENAVSEKPYQGKTVGNINSEEKVQNKARLYYNDKSDSLVLSTTPSSRLKDENELYTSSTFPENATYTKQRKQTTSTEANQKFAQNYVKIINTFNTSNENTAASSQLHKTENKFLNREMNTEADTFTKEDDIPKEPKFKMNESDSEVNERKTADSFDVAYSTPSTFSENTVNADGLDTKTLSNINDKKESNENSEFEELSGYNQDKNDAETEVDGEAKQIKAQERNGESKSVKTLKNEKLIHSYIKNITTYENGNLTSMGTNHFSIQDSNHNVQIYDVTESDNHQETQKNIRNLSRRAGVYEFSPDQEYDLEEYIEDFDISDELGEVVFYQETEFYTNDENLEEDEMKMENTANFLADEPQTDDVKEEKYDTFLDYFYKNSNSSYFQSLKN